MAKETKWSIDPSHSEIAFKIKHLMISHIRGVFKTYDATIVTEGEDFTTADIDMWIDPASIDTGDTKRDKHLTSPDFFDVSSHKQITFKSDSIEKSEAGDLYLYGSLTIRGISKKIKLNIEYGGKMKDSYGNEKMGFTITGKINRKDWGLNWNTLVEAGSMVGDEVIIDCEVQLLKINNDEMKAKEESVKAEKVAA